MYLIDLGIYCVNNGKKERLPNLFEKHKQQNPDTYLQDMQEYIDIVPAYVRRVTLDTLIDAGWRDILVMLDLQPGDLQE